MGAGAYPSAAKRWKIAVNSSFRAPGWATPIGSGVRSRDLRPLQALAWDRDPWTVTLSIERHALRLASSSLSWMWMREMVACASRQHEQWAHFGLEANSSM